MKEQRSFFTFINREISSLVSVILGTVLMCQFSTVTANEPWVGGSEDTFYDYNSSYDYSNSYDYGSGGFGFGEGGGYDKSRRLGYDWKTGCCDPCDCCCPRITIDTPFYSKYVFRGLPFIRGPVFQPSMIVDYRGFEFSVWGNFSLSDRGHRARHTQGKFVQFILDLNYTFCGDLFNYTFGIKDYEFPNTFIRNFVEVYASVGACCFLNPRVTVYHEIDHIHGWLGEFEISHLFNDLWSDSCWGLDLSLGLGARAATRYQSADYVKHFYRAGHRSAWTDAEVQVSLPISVGSDLTISPSFRYASLLNKHIRDRFCHPNNSIWGIDIVWNW